MHHHGGHLHTVVIEPDAKRLIMVWHTAVPCQHTVYTLQETTVFLERSAEGSGAGRPAGRSFTSGRRVPGGARSASPICTECA